MDLDLNAYANARLHFDARKGHASKEAKTAAANEKAMAAAEKKAAAQLRQVRCMCAPCSLGYSGRDQPRAHHW